MFLITIESCYAKISLDIKKPINFLLFHIITHIIVILLCLETPNTMYIT